MKKDLLLTKTLKIQSFSNIDIDHIFNYLETLDYDLNKTHFIGKIVAKNERLAKYFFLRDKLNIGNNFLEETFYINEILDQCIDWSEFWRLLVIKKGFCCIKLSGIVPDQIRFIFLSGPNMLSDPSADISDSIYEHIDY